MAWTQTAVMKAAGLGVLICLLSGCERFVRMPGAKAYAPADSGVVFDAADVLAPEQLGGTGYTVARRVPVMDHDFMFRVRTRYGTIPAHGWNLLELRSYEVRCIEQAAKARGVRKILEGAFGALDETIEGAETLLFDPFGSIKRAPKGLERMVKGKLYDASRRAGSPERRQLALSLGCDPETRNPILKRMLDEIEIQRLIGSLPVQFIPYTGILRLTADIKDEVASTPPHEVCQGIERELAGCGVAGDLRSSFAWDPHFTTVQRLLLMKQFRRLEGVSGRDALLKLAVEGRSENDALGAIEVGQNLVRLHARRPITRFAPRGLPVTGLCTLPVAVVSDGGHVIHAPCDCLVKTGELERAVMSYRAACPSQPTALICSGRALPDVRRVFEAAGITVQEHQRTGAP